MRKFNLFSSAAQSALTALGIQASGDENEDGQAGPLPTPTDPPADPPADGDPVDPPAGDPPAGDPPVEDPPPAEASVDIAMAAEAGAAAERTRTATVFASAEALANPGLAAWMLANGPQASAESIVAQLKTAPVAPGAAAPSIPSTNINVGAGAPAGDEELNGDDVWAEVQGTTASAPVVPAANAAGMNGVRTVNAPYTRTGN